MQAADVISQRLRADNLEPAAATQQIGFQVVGGAQGEFEVGMAVGLVEQAHVLADVPLEPADPVVELGGGEVAVLGVRGAHLRAVHGLEAGLHPGHDAAHELLEHGLQAGRVVAAEVGDRAEVGLDVDYDTDCVDPHSHLNPSGARKVTDFLGRLLREEYDVPDHRAEPAYASWYNDYEAYRAFLLQTFAEHTDFKENLMLLNNSNFTARLLLAEDAVIDTVEQKLIAQLGGALTMERTAAMPDVPRARLTVRDVVTGKEFEKSFW